jgi:hypothetical protein
LDSIATKTLPKALEIIEKKIRSALKVTAPSPKGEGF